MDSFITEFMRRYTESHQQTTSETFIREDVNWGLHGDDSGCRHCRYIGNY